MATISIDGVDYEAPSTANTDRWQNAFTPVLEALAYASAGGGVSVKNFGAIGDGVTDDTKAVQRAVAAAVAGGTRHIHFPECSGGYLFKSENAHMAYGRTSVEIPSNFVVSGEGYPSRILMTGIANENYPATGAFSAFQVEAHATNWRFHKLWFVGENNDVNDFQTPQQNESACIDTSASGGAPFQIDGVISECTAEFLFGFIFHNVGGTRCHVMDCTARWCANGINWNSDHSIQSRNTLYKCEGFEAGGHHVQVVDNSLTDCFGTGIASGGVTLDLYEGPGSLIANNVIDGCTGTSSFGIVTSDGFVNGSIIGNTVMHCDGGGILVQADPPSPPSTFISGRNLVANNIVVDNCISGGGDVSGISITNLGQNSVIGNFCRDRGLGVFLQQIALNVNSPDNFVSDNYLDAPNQELYIAQYATGTRVGENHLVHERIQLISGATILSNNAVGLALTDIVERSRLSTVVNGIDNFRRNIGGELQWLPGSGTAVDTTLGRVGVAQLQTQEMLASTGFAIGAQKIRNAATIPVAGTWLLGDIVFKTDPVSGGFIGWVCTVAGTPGTWKTWGVIS